MVHVEKRWRFLVLFALLIPAACAGAEADGEVPPPLDHRPGELVNSERCGGCHKDIYSVWKTSIHARAASTPVFLEAYDEAVKQAGDTARELCLRCHAPASILTGNIVLSDSLNQEGVSCDFCHSLTGYNSEQQPHPFVLNLEGVKFGPVPDAESVGHPVEYSEFHASSEHCAGCHEYTSPAGVPLLSTYSEWLDYRESHGTESCQGCHMPLVIANVADPRVARKGHSFVNLHSMPGGHSLGQLVKSLRLRFEEVEREADSIRVKLTVSNKGAGHSVPTGSPTRKVILSVSATTTSGVSARQEYVFQRIVADKDGLPIERDSRVLLESASVLSDSRIAAGEERPIETTLSVPAGENVKVQATLTYVYSPHNRPETETRLEFLSEGKDLVTSWSR